MSSSSSLASWLAERWHLIFCHISLPKLTVPRSVTALGPPATYQVDESPHSACEIEGRDACHKDWRKVDAHHVDGPEQPLACDCVDKHLGHLQKVTKDEYGVEGVSGVSRQVLGNVLVGGGELLQVYERCNVKAEPFCQHAYANVQTDGEDDDRVDRLHLLSGPPSVADKGPHTEKGSANCNSEKDVADCHHILGTKDWIFLRAGYSLSRDDRAVDISQNASRVG